MGAIYLKYFPNHILLSMDAKSRFEYLFKARSKWTQDEIVPYIEDLATDKKKLDAMLLKYARASGEKNHITYTSRYVVAK